MSDVLDRLKVALADRYNVERELGSGGMAVVYLAKDLRHERGVAIKVLRPELTSVVAAKRFLREIKLTASLAHPHILPVHDSGEADGFLYYVMPYVEGESLREKLNREKQLPVDEAVRIAREVADALSYAHDQNLLHRDIKPENILLEAGHAVVADFGIARALSEAAGDRLTDTGISIGTPAYMSPEQAAGERELSEGSDLYSLACVLYEMLTGEPPISDPSVQKVVSRKILGDFRPAREVRHEVPLEVDAALSKALTTEPAERFTGARQFAEGLGVVPAGALQGARSRRFWLPWSAVAAAVAVVALGYFALSQDAIESLPEDRVVVFPFENLTGNPNLDDLGVAVAHWITTGLSSSDELHPVQTNDAIQELRSRDDDVTNRELAASLGAGLLVTGVFSSEGDRLRFEAAITRVATGEALPAVVALGPADPQEAMVGVDSLRNVLLGALAVSVDERSAYFAHRPPSYSAYQAFWRGMQNFFDGEMEASAQNYLEAYRQDTTFLMALLGATMASINILEWPVADSLLSVVEPRVDELSPKERSWFEWFTALARGDLEGAFKASRLELARDPGDFFRRNVLAEDAIAVGRMKEAMDAVDQLGPDDPVVRNIRPYPRAMARANHVLGRYQEELQFVHAGIERWPHDVSLRGQEVVALIALGRLDSIDSLLVSIEKMEPRGGGSVGYVLRDVSAELARHGYAEEALIAADRAIRWYSSGDSDSYLLAESYLLAQRPQEAVELIRRVVAEHPDYISARGVLGLALAGKGDQEGAQDEARWIEAVDRPYLYGRDTYWRAAIAAHLGRNEEAVELLRRAHRQGLRLSRLHADPHLAPLWSFEPFERFIAPGA